MAHNSLKKARRFSAHQPLLSSIPPPSVCRLSPLVVERLKGRREYPVPIVLIDRRNMYSKFATAVTTGVAVLSLLPDAYAAPNASPAEPVHVPLVRRKGPQRTPEDYVRIAEAIRVKYGRPTVSSSTRRKRGNTANIQTTNQQGDSSYYAPLTIGTPYVLI